MELALTVAFIAVILTSASSIIDFIQTWHIREVQNQLKSAQKRWDERGGIGDQLGDWLLEKRPEDQLSNLEFLSAKVGQTLYASLRSGSAAVSSGEKRHENMVENRTLEALEASDPEMKMLKSVFERLGLDDLWNPSDIPAVVNVLRKHGVFGQAGSNPSRETQVGWNK